MILRTKGQARARGERAGHCVNNLSARPAGRVLVAPILAPEVFRANLCARGRLARNGSEPFGRPDAAVVSGC